MPIRPLTFAALGLLLAVGPTLAAPTFADLDANGDDMIDRAEFLAAGGARRAFGKLDGNDDGVVSRAEARAAADGSSPTAAQLDIDGDGRIEPRELTYHFGPEANRALAKFDADGDGIVTLDEVRGGNNGRAGRDGPSHRADRAERNPRGADRVRGGHPGRGSADAGDRGGRGNGNAGGNGRGNGNGNGNGKGRNG